MSETTGTPRLLFVYNADSGVFSSLTDYAHKLISPDTYDCNLCALTYGNLGMKSAWKTFLETLPFEVQFLHRDEFQSAFAEILADLPAVYVRSDGLEKIISKSEIESAPDLSALISLVQGKTSFLHNTPRSET